MAPKDQSSLFSSQMRLSFEEEQEVKREDDMSVRCVQCSKKFSQPRWYVEKGIRSQFCSESCRTHWEVASPDEPFELVLEGRPGYRGGNWKTQARLARERDDFCCQLCGVTEETLGRQMDVHHKVPFRLFDSPIEANQLSNLISLCPSCHKKTEEAARTDMPLFGDVKHPGQRSQ